MNLSIGNLSSIDCPSSLQWTPSAAGQRRTSLIVCIVTLIVHGGFWLQLVFSSSIRHRSLQWIYAFLICDLILTLRFVFVYIIRIMPSECVPNPRWAAFICFLDGAVDNYLNTLQVYVLLALNVSRYAQIVHNRNVYTQNVRSLIVSHLIIYALPMLIVMQLFFDWAQLIEIARDSCDVAFTTIYNQTFNVILTLILPIGLNVLVILGSVQHIRRVASLRILGRRVSARDKYHQSLIIQFLLFYLIWLSLWSPNLIVYQFTSGLTELTTTVRLLNFFETMLDPLIVGALDVRLWQLWRKIFLRMTEKYFRNWEVCGRKIRPIATEPPIPTVERFQRTAM
jgi:hypothetical protein